MTPPIPEQTVPEHVGFDIRRENELTILVDCVLDDILDDSYAVDHFLSTEGFIANYFPTVSNTLFSFAMITYILAAV